MALIVLAGCDRGGSAEEEATQAAAIAPTSMPAERKAAVFEATGEEVVIRDQHAEEIDRFAAPISVTNSIYDPERHVVYAYGKDLLYVVDLDEREVRKLASLDYVAQRCDVKRGYQDYVEGKIFRGEMGFASDGQNLCILVNYLSGQPHVDLTVEYRIPLLQSEAVTSKLVNDTLHFCDPARHEHPTCEIVPDARPRQPHGHGLTLDQSNCEVTFPSGQSIVFSDHEKEFSARCALEVFDQSPSGRAIGIYTTKYEEFGKAIKTDYRYLDTEREEIIAGIGERVRGAEEPPYFHSEADLTLSNTMFCRLFPESNCRPVQSATFL